MTNPKDTELKDLFEVMWEEQENKKAYRSEWEKFLIGKGRREVLKEVNKIKKAIFNQTLENGLIQTSLVSEIFKEFLEDLTTETKNSCPKCGKRLFDFHKCDECSRKSEKAKK